MGLDVMLLAYCAFQLGHVKNRVYRGVGRQCEFVGHKANAFQHSVGPKVFGG